MFSTDPAVYGMDVNTYASAATIEADLLRRLEQVAAAFRPPFSAAQRKALQRMMTDCTEQSRRLSQLRNRHIIEGPSDPRARTEANRLARLLTLWDDCAVRFEEALAGHSGALVVAQEQPDTRNEAALASADRLFELFHLALSPEVPVLHRPGGVNHGDIPLSMAVYLSLIRAAARVQRSMGHQGPLSFVDVGCGLGLKLIAAQEMFERVEGVEIDPKAAAKAAALARTCTRNRRTVGNDARSSWLTLSLPTTRMKVHNVNALEFGGYGGFDVIYAYRPIADDDLRAQLERRIVTEARPGAVLIMPYSDFGMAGTAEGLGKLDRFLYLKEAPGLTAETVLQRASHMGNLRPLGDVAEEGFVRPLAQLLRQWGHLA